MREITDRAGASGQCGAWGKRKNLPPAASIAASVRPCEISKAIISLGFSPWHGACCSRPGPHSNCAHRSSAMLPAIGAASAALDAIQSLTSPQPAASQPVGFGPVLPDASDSSAASSAGSPTLSGFSSAQISSDNISALIDAQSLTSGDLAGALDSGSSDSSQSQSTSASGTASSAYSAINQLVQSTAIPLGFNPFSLSA